MKTAYPIVLTQGQTHIVAYAPDFDINTQGRSLADALYMARDAIYQVGMSLLDDGLPLPELSCSMSAPEPGSFVATVEVDFDGCETSDAGIRVGAREV
jgi:predicted RNase H-like HicB family nuclease